MADTINTYRDSKELPLYNYKRIIQTGDFFYMVKGYDGDSAPDSDLDEMQQKYNSAVKDYAFSLNSVNADIVNYGNIEKAKNNIYLLALALEIIELQIYKNEIKKSIELPVNNEIINTLLSDVKVTKSENLQDQAEIIKGKIDKLQNEINEALKKLEKNQPEGVETDIDEVIINVALILEYAIDERKTSLYQFGILQKQARQKIEHLAKQKT